MNRAGPDSMRAARRSSQRGAALLTAMIIVALVATLAASMVWQQWRAVQVEAAERKRSQATWLLTAALDWARLVLRSDGRDFDGLQDPWATPLAEARLSTFLAPDKDNTDIAPDVFLAGSITDAQSRYNLTNLVASGTIDPVELAGFGRLCHALGLRPDLALQVAQTLLTARLAKGNPASAPAAASLRPTSVDQLTWLGIDPEAVRALRPYVALLDDKALVNVNTAPREVLLAAIDGLDLAGAERLIESRRQKAFRATAEAQALFPQLPLKNFRVGVTTNFFEVDGRLRDGDQVLEERSLVERSGNVITVKRRESVTPAT